MLIAALQVEIGRPSQLALFAHGRMTHAGVEPHIQDVLLLAELRPRALLAGHSRCHELLDRFRVPSVHTLLFNDIGHVVEGRLIRTGLLARLAIEDGDRHSPRALTRDAPIRARFDHAQDAIDPPARNPVHPANRSDGFLAKVAAFEIHPDEPLRGRPEHDRVVASPAMRIAVLDIRAREQVSALLKERDDRLVGLEDELALHLRELGRVLAAGIDRRIDIKPIARADAIVVHTVSGCRVHRAGTGILRNVVAEHDERLLARNERMLSLLLV